MNKFKTAVLLISALVSVISVTGCGNNSNSSVGTISYVDNSSSQETTVNEHETDLGASITVDTTTFTVHNVIDVDKTTDDGEKYIYVEYTIKNDSDKIFYLDNLNNFYLKIGDTEYKNDVRANLYAKQSINDYVELESVSVGGEVTSYVGFIVPKNTTSVTCGYYVTSGDKTDKQNAIVCDVQSSEWISPPEGMLK